MANAVVATSPADQFRAKAADGMINSAKMSLHELVDEFQRLTQIMDDNTSQEEGRGKTFNEIAELADRDCRIVQGAARARFGITLESFDRPSSHYGYGDF